MSSSGDRRELCKSRARLKMAIEASSGKVVRHRLKAAVGTGRPEQCAVYGLPGSNAPRWSHKGVRRLRRTQEGKSKREIIRCLKRYS